MQKLTTLLLAGPILTLAGCATAQQGDNARFQPRPPFLLNALADTADTIADHAPGPLAYPPRVHATIFRSLTPGFWLDRREQAASTELAEQDAKFLQQPIAQR